MTIQADRVPGSLAEQLEDPCFFLVDFDFHDEVAVFAHARIEWFAEKLRLSAFDFPLECLRAVPLSLVERALPQHTQPATNYLFHMPFSGSTYLTRMLEHDGVLLLRDPTAHDAAFHREPETDGVLELARRVTTSCFNRRAGSRSTVVRTAGYYPEMIPGLVNASTFRAGLLLYSSPEDYIIQVLKSAQRRRHVRLLMAKDKPFVTERCGETLDTVPDAIVAALFWLRFTDIVLRDGAALRTLDCERLFAEPARTLARIEQLWDIEGQPVAPRVEFASNVHAKTGSSFSIDDRNAELARGREAHAAELAAARECLDAAGATQMLASLEARQL